LDLFIVYIINKSDNSGVILIFATIIGAIVGFLGTWYVEKKRWKNEKKKEKRRTYSQLKGCTYLILQTFALNSRAHIDMLYLNYSLTFLPYDADDDGTIATGKYTDVNSKHVERVDEARYRLIETSLETAKSREKFEKYLADAELLFSESSLLIYYDNYIDILITDIYTYWRGIDKDFAAISNKEASIAEQKVELYNLRQCHLDEYPKKINSIRDTLIDLLNYLKSELGESKANLDADDAIL